MPPIIWTSLKWSKEIGEKKKVITIIHPVGIWDVRVTPETMHFRHQ